MIYTFKSNSIWWSSLICNASARQEQDKCDKSDTSATRVRHERHEYDTSEKILILKITWVKTYFHIPIFTIWQVKDYKERNNFILSTAFWNASFPSQNASEKCTTKTGLCNGKSYIKKLYTRLKLQISLHVPASLRIVMQPHFDENRFMWKYQHFFKQ